MPLTVKHAVHYEDTDIKEMCIHLCCVMVISCQNINDPLRMICSVGLKDTYGNETSGFEHHPSIIFLKGI